MLKKTIKIIALFIVFSIPLHFALSDELIIPKKKPMLSEEVINQKLSRGEIIPLKKPSETKEAIIIKKEKIEKSKVTKIIDGEIIPKSKPLVVTTEKSKKAKKSKYYSKKDFEIARNSINYMEQRKWGLAEKTAKKAKDKSIYTFVRWRHLITPGNQLSFYEYKRFIELNPKYPRINRIKYLAEHKMSISDLSPNFISLL